ncbi:hypothetical protein DQ04_01231070 [Trypanosoma grayi]|uniref:hypothetical protein n=1 Tax=Trypanosoma grayi TaxID=71804 RepID=UPI0004F42E1B|nr:hypothetical protein DQ04_01231070 [Trypanosoma grayi]KEG13072.1 hypothetical protein DQ04_01231070 [Trypanosoma grayi]
MQGWYQFGYDGFPSGEARRQFYRQRDDPCDSEEEREAYDGNDRPVYYYPMHESEEASSVERDDVEELSSLPPASPSPLHVSAWETCPGRCGSAIVPLCKHNCCCENDNTNNSETEGDVYYLLHGGAVVVAGQVTNSSEVLRVKAYVNRVAVHDSLSAVALDASLAAAIRFTGEDPFVAAELDGMADIAITPPRRFGHAAVAIPISEAAAAAMLSPENRTTCELHFSLIIGGAFSDQVPKNLHDVRIRGSVMCEPWLCITVLRRHENTKVKGIACSAAHSAPGSRTELTAAHWTLHCPLTGLAPFTATPRVFATLTAWPIVERETITASYAYLGGSMNGWDPLPLFGLWLLHVDVTNWKVSITLLETLGEEPPPRFGHSAVVVESEELYVFGGIGARRTYLNDLVVLNCATRVWREVFVPSVFSMPPRAFHSSLLLPHFTAILIIGGEAGGCHEPSVWIYSVDRGNWRLMTFPLLDCPFSLLSAKGELVPGNRVIGAAQLLCEQERSNAERRNGSSDAQLRHIVNQPRGSYTSPSHNPPPYSKSGFNSSLPAVASGETTGTPLSTYYFAAMHGSLLHALSMDGGVLVVGGTKSPCVMSLSWLPARDYSLKESAAMWICMHRSHPFSERRRGPQSRNEMSMSRAPMGYKGNAPPVAKTPNERANLVERSLAEYQLDQWRRSAQKRLRDQ